MSGADIAPISLRDEYGARNQRCSAVVTVVAVAVSWQGVKRAHQEKHLFLGVFHAIWGLLRSSAGT